MGGLTLIAGRGVTPPDLFGATGVVTMNWPYLDHPLPIPFAHRGASGDWPENTMRAFAAAVGLGYRYVETDVHATADGVLVAFHDAALDRVTDAAGAIGVQTWEQVRRARVAGEPIPLLEDLLGAWPQLHVNVDPKADAAIAPLVDVLSRTAAFDRVCVGAFSDARLARFRRLTGGRVCTALGPNEVRRLRIASWAALPAGRFAGACAQVPVRRGRVRLVDRRFVRGAHRAGLQVHVWTVNTRAAMESLLDLGVDGIMTDYPALLKDVLLARGLWHGTG